MAEDAKPKGQDESSQEPASSSAPVPDITEEEDLDIEIERAAMKPARRGSGVFWTLLVIIAAVIVLLVGLQLQRQREEAARKQREIREAAYAAQEKGIMDSIQRAAELASKGEIDMAFEQLRDAEEKWGTLAAAANSNNPPDTERAQYANSRRDRLKKTLNELEGDRKKAEEYAKQAADLEAQARELAKKRDQLNSALRAKILQLVGADSASSQEPGQGASSQPSSPQPAPQ